MNEINTHGLSAHPARTAAAMPVVTGRCPACGSSSLFLAVGGYVTCSIIECPNPTAVADMLNRPRPENVEEPGYLKARGAVSGTEPAEVVIRRIRGQEENVEEPT